MRGTRARLQRHSLMSPALRTQMKNEIAALAAIRAEKIGAVNKDRKTTIRNAQNTANRLHDAAYEEFDDARNGVVAKYNAIVDGDVVEATAS